MVTENFENMDNEDLQSGKQHFMHFVPWVRRSIDKRNVCSLGLACFMYLITVLCEYDVFGQEDADDNASGISLPMFNPGGGGGPPTGPPIIPTPPLDVGSRPAADRASTSRKSATELPGMILDKFERRVEYSM